MDDQLQLPRPHEDPKDPGSHEELDFIKPSIDPSQHVLPLPRVKSNLTSPDERDVVADMKADQVASEGKWEQWQKGDTTTSLDKSTHMPDAQGHLLNKVIDQPPEPPQAA